MRRLLAAAASRCVACRQLRRIAQTDLSDRPRRNSDRARFDFKVEFPERVVAPTRSRSRSTARITPTVFGKAASFIEREDGKDQSALILRDVSLTQPGDYKVQVTDGTRSREVTWTVYDTGPRQAKNVILFIGDGMSLAHRVAARLLSKGIAEGKACGKLAIDDMPHMALVATAGSDSIITDSANSASAYATGHKIGGQRHGRLCRPHRRPVRRSAGRDHHRAWCKRRHGLAVGIVTNTEIEDATPAAMVAHTRRRGDLRRDRRAVSSRPSPTCSWAAARPISCRRARAGSQAQGRRRLHRQIPRCRLRGRRDGGRD